MSGWEIRKRSQVGANGDQWRDADPSRDDHKGRGLSPWLGVLAFEGAAVARTFSGARLRQKRTAAGIKPERLALTIDRSVYSVHEYERGRANPSADVLGALADALNCPVDDFYAADEVLADAA
jgi:DNA-binding XRE family transcriptional regulator